MNMIALKESYPIFTANQVLTDKDLNGVVEYLEQQSRLTRTHLIGMGILSGMTLEAKIIEELSKSQQITQRSQIIISAGCGITSEGYVISLEETILTGHKTVQIDSDSLFKTNQIKVSNGNGNGPAGNYQVTELFVKLDNNHPDNVISLPSNSKDFEDFLANKILVVVCEIKVKESDSCSLNYDQGSKARRFRLRFFLLARQEAEKLLRVGYQMDQLSEPWKTFDSQYGTQKVFEIHNHFLQEFERESDNYKDIAPRIHRFGYAKKEDNKQVDLTKIKNYQDFRDNYSHICLETIDEENEIGAIVEIGEAFPKLFQLFSPFFSSFQPKSNIDFAKLSENLKTILNSILGVVKAGEVEALYILQYFWDYLGKLITAYYELAEATFDLMDDSQPNTHRFPKFLMLGEVLLEQLTKEYEPHSAYRSHFVQPPIYNNNNLRVQRVRYLYDRLLLLADTNNFKPLPFYEAPIKITPSKDKLKQLSDQAIPYYLNYSKLYQAWNFDAYRQGRSAKHPAYFLPPQEESRDELLYQLNAYNFYRIEGHIGKDITVAQKLVSEYKRQYSLGFDIVTLKLGEQNIDDANISGELDVLKEDFQGVQHLFNKLWEIYESDWSNNVFLSTLKQIFFDEPNLSNITDEQLYNPILAIVRSDSTGEVFEFEAEENGNESLTGKYRLFIRDAEGNRLAHFAFVGEEQANEDWQDLLNLSEFQGEELIQERKRIMTALSNSLKAERFAYQATKQDGGNGISFSFSLLFTEKFDFPIDSTNGESQGMVLVKLISQNNFTVTQDSDQPPLVNEEEFKNFETLYGLLRDVPDNYADQNEIDFDMGNHSAAVDYINAFDIQHRIEAYQRQAEAYQQQGEQMGILRQFHKFAECHPSMEHLGGVSEEGTFILVYADDNELAENLLTVYRDSGYQNRIKEVKESASPPPAAPGELEKIEQEFMNWKNIVVADYCLPYRCWNNTLNSKFKFKFIALPPIILLEKTSFCAGDSNRYKFLLYPMHGNLKGEGISFKAEKDIEPPKYYFIPEKIQQPIINKSTITFTYLVDGCYSTLVITIDAPDASFKIGESDKTEFCTNHPPITLIPQMSGGKFTAFDDSQELPINQGDENPINEYQFDPSKINLGGLDEKEITLKYEVKSDDKNCTNIVKRNTTIHALPNANFKIGDRDEDITSICADVASVSLIPDESNNGLFRALDLAENQDISARVLQGDRFLPSAVNLGEQTEKKIILEYTVTSDKGCTNHTEKEITILALPDAIFQVGDPPKTEFCTDDSPITLIPQISEGAFTAFDGSQALPINQGDESPINGNQFDPSKIDLGGFEEKEITLRYEVTSDNGCTHYTEQKIVIFALPDASFKIGESDKTEFCIDARPITLIPRTSGGKFIAFDDSQELAINPGDDNPIDGYQFDPSKIDLGGNLDKTIILKYVIESQEGCLNDSTREITIHALPNADFKIVKDNQEITSVCADVASVSLIPDESNNGLFRALDLAENQDISARVLQGDRFLPSVANLGEQPEKKITLEYTVTGDKRCTKTTSKEITIHALPNASFQVGDPPKTVFFTNEAPIDLIPRVSGGTFSTSESSDLIVDNQFDPSKVNLDGATQKVITVTYTVTNEHRCTNETQKDITIRSNRDQPNPPDETTNPNESTTDESNPDSPQNSNLEVRVNPSEITLSQSDPLLTRLNFASNLLSSLESKLTWTFSLGAIATLLILGWTGSLSNQSENPNHTSRPNEIHNSTQ